MSEFWEMNTRQALGNVEKGLRSAHHGLDELQAIVDKARELMDAGGLEGVQVYIEQLDSALGGLTPRPATLAV